MSDAVVVKNAYKKFGNLNRALWERKPRLYGKAAGSAESGLQPYIVALDHVSFTVRQGEIFGVLGPSGSGKSTLIRLLATLILPDGGDLQVFGYDVVGQPKQVQRLINRVSVEASFFKKLSPLENLVYGARAYEMSAGEERRQGEIRRRSETRRQAVEILGRLGFEQHAIHKPMEEMSRSMQQKAAIARALLTHPRLLLMDDPTTGLDPLSKHEVHSLFRELRDQFDTTILLTTHDMAEAQSLCDRIAIISGGKLVALETPRKGRQGTRN
jgi:ABC-2 type transport system ATP-binding protein